MGDRKARTKMGRIGSILNPVAGPVSLMDRDNE